MASPSGSVLVCTQARRKSSAKQREDGYHADLQTFNQPMTVTWSNVAREKGERERKERERERERRERQEREFLHKSFNRKS